MLGEFIFAIIRATRCAQASLRMELISIPFNKQLIITKDNQQVVVNVFHTAEDGNIKLGIVAPKGIAVDREEIYARKQKKKNDILLAAE